MTTINEEAITLLLNVLNYLNVDNKKKAFDEVIKAIIKLREDNSTYDSVVPTVNSIAPTININTAPSVDSAVPSVDSAVPSVDSAVPSVDSAVPSVDSIVSTIDSVVPTIDSVIPTIDSVVPIDDIARTSVDINALYSSSVDMSANKSVKTSFDISVVTSGSKSVVTSGSKSVVTSGSKSVVTSGSKSVVTINGKTVRSNWGDSDYEDDDDDNDDKKKSITFLYSEVVTSKIPTMTTLENSKIVPVKPVKKLPMRFTTIRYYDITNYINMTNNKSRDVNTILTDMFAFNMSNSEIISIKEYSEGVKIIFTIPDSEFKKASFKDGNNGIKYKLRNIIFSDYNSSHVPSQYK